MEPSVVQHPPDRGEPATGIGRRYSGADAATRRAERLARLEAAARDLFATRGYRQTTIAAICEASHVSRRHFYEQFVDREALLRHLYDAIQARTRAAVLVAIGEHSRTFGGGPIRRGPLIRAALEAYVNSLVDDPYGVRVAFVEVVGVSAAMEEHRLHNRRDWAQLMQGAGVVVGMYPVRPWVYSAFIPSVNEYLMAWWQDSDDHADRSDLVAVLASVLVTLMRDAGDREGT